MEINEKLRKCIDSSYQNALKQHHEFITPEHLLLALLSDTEVNEVITSCDVDPDKIKNDVKGYIKEKVMVIKDAKKQHEPFVTDGFNSLIDYAAIQCSNADKKSIGTLDILVAMLYVPNLYCTYFLKKNGIEEMQLLENVSILRSGILKDTSVQEAEEISEETETRHKEDNSFLKKYATDLTKKAREGKFDKLVGRENEIDRTIQVLCRRTKNNPLHVGDAGVGKTAITEGLAQMIVQGKVPDLLKDFSVYSIDMGTIVAGTKFRGEFEERLKKIVTEIQKKKKAILFIDEIHTLIGSGTADHSTLDGANILKPLLADDTVRCIGSTTFDEYTRIFEKDRALSRRFQKIDIIEPTRDETLKILKGIAPRYESYHKVKYTADALEAAVDLSIQFITDRRLPDKAIDLIDEAGSYLKLHSSEKTVDANVIRKVTSSLTKIPLETLTTDEKENLKDLSETLSSQVLGQDKAIEKLCTAVKKARSGLGNPDKPEASFLFVGPTGVGKTELAKVLAKTLNEPLLRFDMSEYQEKHTVSRLIGAPPGYVGFDDSGILTKAVRKENHAVILFDEIEKAHPDIYNVLLQIFDYGTLTDNHGTKADFRNCMIIMTSNAGARDMEKGAVGFAGLSQNQNDEATLKHAVEEQFTPEFRNRLDAIIPFAHLPPAIVEGIAKKAVSRIAERLKTKKIKLKADKSAIQLIADKGYSREYGARNVERVVEEEIASPLVDEILFGKLSSGGKVTVSAKDGKIAFDFHSINQDAGK
ncbi:MAG: AAA family ATPase [Treponema sp.]|nr:AAA family ATPase [Treponema sp.]MBR7079090.1 AAA family ATPase [Treponema sp.]